MQLLDGIFRLILCVVFAVAGAAKLRDLKGSRKAVADFGLPAVLAQPLGTVLPFAELSIAIALAPTTTARWAAVAATGALVLFTAVMAINLARGRKPDCHCFGQVHSKPIGASTVIRNLVLAGIAASIAWQESIRPAQSLPGLFASLVSMPGVAVLAGCVTVCLLALQTWFIIHLARQNGRLLVRIEAIEAGLPVAGRLPAAAPGGDLPIGTMAPAFRLPDLAERMTSLQDLCAANKTLLLLFIDPQCATCKTLLPDLGTWRRERGTAIRLVLITRGTAHENRFAGSGIEDVPVLLQRDRETAAAFGIREMPGAVFIRSDGTVGSALMVGPDAIRRHVLGLTNEQKAAKQGTGSGKCRPCQQAKERLSRPISAGEPAPGITLTAPLVNAAHDAD